MLDRGVAQLPGLMFVAVGMSLLAAAVLVPAWTSNQQLARQHAILQHQAERMTAQRERYVTFHDALAADDPQLLQRLAFSQLHVRPIEGEPWPGDGIRAADDRLAITASVDAALAEPVEQVRPKPPVDAPPSRLVRLASGTSRLLLLAAAVCFVLGGLWYGKPAPAAAPVQPVPA